MSRGFPTAVANALSAGHVSLITFCKLAFPSLARFTFTTLLAPTPGVGRIGLALVILARLVLSKKGWTFHLIKLASPFLD